MDSLVGHDVILGTYEEFVLGFTVVKGEEPRRSSLALAPSFSDHAHAGGAVRALAASGKFVASGAADENVRLLNLRRRTHHGDLRSLHQDTVTQLLFYDRSHLITAADDGKICILRTKNFHVEKTLSKHTGGVTSLALHPSGKLAISVGKDRKLITWNLIKGRSAYVTNVKEISDLVRWSPDGSRYLVCFRGRVYVYSTESAKVDFSIPLGNGNGRANEIAFLDADTALVAGDAPELEVHCLEEKRLLHKFKAHERRVRCLHVQKTSAENEFGLVTSSNDGLVKVWRLRREGKEGFEAECLCERDTGCRVTCMVVHKVPEVQEQQQQSEDKEEQQEEGEEAKQKKRKRRKRKAQPEGKASE